MITDLLARLRAGEKYEVIRLELGIADSTIRKYRKLYSVKHPNTGRGGHTP